MCSKEERDLRIDEGERKAQEREHRYAKHLERLENVANKLEEARISFVRKALQKVEGEGETEGNAFSEVLESFSIGFYNPENPETVYLKSCGIRYPQKDEMDYEKRCRDIVDIITMIQMQLELFQEKIPFTEKDKAEINALYALMEIFPDVYQKHFLTEY